MTGRTRSRLRVRSLATCVATLTIGLALTADPAAADRSTAMAAAEGKFEVTAEFDKPSYRSGDLITITVNIKNVGTEKFEGLRAGDNASKPGALQHPSDQWGDFSTQAGVTIEAGATRTVTLSGHQQTADAETVTLSGNLFNQRGLSISSFSFNAPIVKRLGHVAGIVFGDKNNNGAFDQGEGLASVEIRLSDGQGSTLKATSDAGGRFDFGQIPTVTYFRNSIITDGWVIPFERVIVDESDRTSDLRLRGERPLAGALTATMKFTKDSYQPGEVAHVTVTLTNSGKLNLFGIVADCDHGGFAQSLDGDGPGWGDLAFSAKGVTIPAGQTLTLDVSETVPKAAQDVGHVSVGCDFGYRDGDIDSHASAGDEAAAPGGIATVVGDVLNFPEDHGSGKPTVGIAGVKVTLVNTKRDCPVVAETTTDAKGHFEFTNLAPGPNYVVYFIPPQGWKIKFENPTPTEVRAGSGGRLVIEVVPGDGPLPTVPSCSPSTPEPQGRSSGGLANTGASVGGLTALGALALLAGAAALVATRRRRKTA